MLNHTKRGIVQLPYGHDDAASHIDSPDNSAYDSNNCFDQQNLNDIVGFGFIQKLHVFHNSDDGDHISAAILDRIYTCGVSLPCVHEVMKLRFPFHNGIIGVQNFLAGGISISDAVGSKPTCFTDNVVYVFSLFGVGMYFCNIDDAAILRVCRVLELFTICTVFIIRRFCFQILVKSLSVYTDGNILRDAACNLRILLFERIRKFKITNGSYRGGQKHDKPDQGIKDRTYQ